MIVLVPSAFELNLGFPGLGHELRPGADAALPGRPGVRLACCGVGLAQAGAAAASVLARHPGRACVLVGLAGTYDPGALPVGSVLLATSIAVDGLGVGEGADFVPLAQLDGPLAGERALAASSLPCSAPAGVQGVTRGVLLSVASASASPAVAWRRRRLAPGAHAEDMEAHAVALAAALAGVKLACVRGISNVAGDRDHSRWQVEPALSAARAVTLALLESGW